MTAPLREFLKSHPFLGKLRWFRRPRKGSSVERTIDALCERREVMFDEDGDVAGLPSNKELAQRLGISEATVRQHIEVDAGRDIEVSAEKRIRQTARRTAVNRARLSRIRTFVKKVESAIASGDKGAARAAFVEAQPELQRGAQKGVMHKNTVARKLSRLSARIKAL